MPRPIAVIGAPTSAGAFAPGPEETPAALRAAGLIYKLRQAGTDIVDYGDVQGFRWAPDLDQPLAMHAGVVARVALELAERVASATADGRLALVLGGDCAVGIGTYLGVRRSYDEPWLLYLDPHPDLNTPENNTSGALGWMGNAHLLGCPGTVSQLVDLDDGPALEPERLILLGASPTRSREAEREVIETLGIKVIAEADVAADPQSAAAKAITLIGNAPYALHFDSDCIDFNDLPICENTDRNVGLSHQTAFQSLTQAATGPGLQAITITQITPYHGAADGSTLRTFTDGLVTALINSTAD
ncbi:MAG: arginase family protein [Streptosporangiaceae bacterium]